MTFWRAVWSLAVVASVSPVLAGPTYIVVNLGDYPSAAKAAGDEANVGWDDGKDADDTICTECYAAVDLQRCLRKMTGDKTGFEIVDDDKVPSEGALIILGNPKSNTLLAGGVMKLDLKDEAFASLGNEGYLIKTGALNTGRQIMVIGGATRIGTLYGVYGFLDRLGVRWFAPGEAGEEVPQQALDRLPPIDITDKPMFFTRGFHAWEYRGDEQFFDWMARNRMNYWCVEEKNRPGLKKRGIKRNCGNHVLIPRFLGPTEPYPYNHATFAGDDGKNLPADPYPVSPDFKGDVNKDGKLTYFEAHPEWYGLIKGKRSDNIVGDGGDNFCTANKDAVDEFMKNLVQDLIDGVWKDADSLNFWTLDGGRWCECEKCKALGISSDRNLLLVHRCRQEMKKAQAEGRLKRDLMIYFLAYADVLSPPTRPLPADFDYDHCIATYFPIARCYVHALNDPKCTEFNTRYEKNLYGWAIDPDRHYKGQIFIGEYYNVSGYRCLPVMFARTMCVDMPYYYKMAARHMHYMHCTTKNWGTKALTNYQFAKMMWKTDLDCAALLSDYFAKRYGPAADTMKGLYDRLDTALCNVTELKYHLSGLLNRNAKNLFPRKHMKYEKTHFDTDEGPSLTEMVAAIDDCRRILVEAQARDLPERIKARLAEDAGPLTYGANTIHFYDVLVRMTRLIHEGKRDEAATLAPEMERLVKALREDTTSTAWSSSHASSPNAFEASYVKAAYQRLSDEFAPAKVHLLEKGKPFAIPGKAFIGGGRSEFGIGLRAGDKTYSEQGNYVYAKAAAPLDSMKAKIELKTLPADGVILYLVGMCCPQPGKTDVAVRIAMNGETVYEGPSEFPGNQLGSRQYKVPAGFLKAGVNELVIANTEPEGPRGGKPWFGIDRVEFRVP